MSRWSPLVRFSFLTAPLVLGFLLTRGPVLGDDKNPDDKKPDDKKNSPPLAYYRIGPPDVLQVECAKGMAGLPPFQGKFLVRPDGTIGLGPYGPVRVTGMTIEEARKAVARALQARSDSKMGTLEQILDSVQLDVAVYASNVYYVLIQNDKEADRVLSFPATGKDSVLDALARVGVVEKLPARKMRIVRPLNGSDRGKVLTVDWPAITMGVSFRTNHQLLPGDVLIVGFEEP